MTEAFGEEQAQSQAGDTRVDAVLEAINSSVAESDDLSERIAVFEEAHEKLRAVLADAGADASPS